MDDCTLTFDGAKVREEFGYTWLALKLTPEPANGQLAMQYVLDASGAGVRQAVLGPQKRKRSLDANAYAWVLMDKIARKVGRKKEDVYFDQIQNVGGNSDVLCLPQKAVERFCQQWENKGLGWRTRTMESKLPGCVNVVVYYGSSTFDAAQMHRFLDGIIQDCKALDIETKTPLELAELERQWAGR